MAGLAKGLEAAAGEGSAKAEELDNATLDGNNGEACIFLC